MQNKYVATSNPSGLTWQNSVPLTGDVPAEIGKLKEGNGPLIQVHGSCQLIQTLLSHDLIDQIRLWTFPVVVGGGKRLFRQGSAFADLNLVKTDTTSNGVVMGIYRRTRHCGARCNESHPL